MVRGYNQATPSARMAERSASRSGPAHSHVQAVHSLMRFGPAIGRPHEERPLRAGHRTASILITFHARPEADIDAVATEVEDILRERLADWYKSRGHMLLEAAPDVA